MSKLMLMMFTNVDNTIRYSCHAYYETYHSLYDACKFPDLKECSDMNLHTYIIIEQLDGKTIEQFIDFIRDKKVILSNNSDNKDYRYLLYSGGEYYSVSKESISDNDFKYRVLYKDYYFISDIKS